MEPIRRAFRRAANGINRMVVDVRNWPAFKKGMVALTVYLLALGVATAYGFVAAAEDDRHATEDRARLEATTEQLQRTTRELKWTQRENTAQGCVNSHVRLEDIHDAINVVPQALLEVSPDADPARVQRFLAAIERGTDEAMPEPTCNLKAAQRELELVRAEREAAND